MDLEQERQKLLEKYGDEIWKDFGNEDKEFKYVLCQEFQHLCIDAEPEFAIKVIKSLYEK